jgi:hypothetical protein
MLRVASDDSELIQVPAGAIAQAWRDGRRQVLLTRALRHCDEVPLDGPLARTSGLLCGQSKTSDIVDASVALAAAGLARRGAVSILTSDVGDIEHLIATLGINSNIISI